MRGRSGGAFSYAGSLALAQECGVRTRKRHVASVFDLDAHEQAALWQLAAEVRARLVVEFHPTGFNVGVNDGKAAGQTVMYAHIHVIPRYTGDVDDPRGGTRRLMPGKVRYWKKDR